MNCFCRGATTECSQAFQGLERNDQSVFLSRSDYRFVARGIGSRYATQIGFVTYDPGLKRPGYIRQSLRDHSEVGDKNEFIKRGNKRDKLMTIFSRQCVAVFVLAVVQAGSVPAQDETK